MTDLVAVHGEILETGPGALPVPVLIADHGEDAWRRFIEFFTAQIRNANTRKAYGRAVADFFGWCERHEIGPLIDIEPVHVAAWVEDRGRNVSAPTVKQNLAAVRHLFDWLVSGGVLPGNPATSVRGPKHVVRKGKTPILNAKEARKLLDSLPTDKIAGLRDRALIALMTCSFARIGAAVAMDVKDVFHQHGRLWVRLHEKGGKPHAMPCHHNLERYLLDYIEAAGIGNDRDSPLFRSIDRKTKALSERRLNATESWYMVRRRGKQAGISTEICNHTFRGTGITAYLENEGQLEKAAQMAAHSSTRTTQLYDRRDDEVTQDEVERIVI